MARPIKYFSEKERMDAIKRTKTRYMLNKEWRCEICVDIGLYMLMNCQKVIRNLLT